MSKIIPHHPDKLMKDNYVCQPICLLLITFFFTFIFVASDFLLNKSLHMNDFHDKVTLNYLTSVQIFHLHLL